MCGFIGLLKAQANMFEAEERKEFLNRLKLIHHRGPGGVL